MKLKKLLALNCLSLSSKEAEKIATSSHKQANLLCPKLQNWFGFCNENNEHQWFI